ncbi:malto-oligosyltrehalose synthase [Paraflavisolibacter sp. H34]|uniref:malto-oligosyltrehalose synthase n=1 Tax=Huijunlia imazamoxiresistens TaxID=3127457 RepID=UPI003018686E
MYNPIATYRLQFHKEFTFADFEQIIPYLQQLGIGTVYASPIFESTAGSTHGYDGLNPDRIDPEIGTEEQLKELSRRLKEAGIGWLQDIVPNHMAFHPGNTWLMDVLEKGPQSVYARFFDIAWTSTLHQGRLMVPFLGAPLDEVIANGELKLAFRDGRLVLAYFDNAYPLMPRSYVGILEAPTGRPPQAIEQLLEQMAALKEVEEAKMYSEQWHELLLQLTSLMKNEKVRAYVEAALEAINNSPESLRALADEQSYNLCPWQETDKRINYRRFFTVNGLICLNIQDEEVFREHHRYLKSLVDEGVFQGLRVDHIDGLYDPTGYLERLRELAGPEAYLGVEKILEAGERLPSRWPVQGNTGYDFITLTNNLLTRRESEEAFTDFYEELIQAGTNIPYDIRQKKAHILYQHMGGELENLYRLFMELNLVEKRAFASFRKDDLKAAIGEFLIQCPVYRYYAGSFPLQEAEAAAVQEIFHRIRRTDRDLGAAVGLLETALLRRPQPGADDYNSRALRFYRRCMQFTGPLMAKGLEDTMMYTFNRCIGLNEVGGSPEMFGLSVEEFHQKMQERQEQWPLSLNATATHDTKRGEDARARLAVLTDLPDEWIALVRQWRELNAPHKQGGFPDANDEYFIYQSLVGAYPMPGEKEEDFAGRLEAYLEKALREAKRFSNWSQPNEAYETATKAFAHHLLSKRSKFWKSFQPFFEKVADFGILNSLTQVVLKATCPGVPDIYQGTELWDLSFVDPDNRRPVDYAQRQRWLEQLAEGDEFREGQMQELWEHRHDGRIKLWLQTTLLHLSRQVPEVFAQGEYHPLKVEGACKDHVLAFGRKYRRLVYIVAVPLHLARLCAEQGKGVTALDWKDTRIILPNDARGEWEHQLLRTRGTADRDILLKNIFGPLPFAVIRGKREINVRGAGLLLHLTSLPSRFGIGDMGPEAYAFAHFLERSRQKFWQLLPLNPTEGGQGHSPYSAISSRAGNVLLISPEILAKEGLLDPHSLSQSYLPPESLVNYEAVEKIKGELYRKAYDAFCKGEHEGLRQQFEQFCEKEADWLHDFALYLALKKMHGGKPWYEWPEPYKQRTPEALGSLEEQHAAELEQIKWLQFIFDRQYSALKTYCNAHDIQLLGDLPIYVSYDSADVWSHRDIFSLDEEGARLGIAGVPPDAFSDDGQLWGMPVYCWDVLKQRNYDWWVERFRRNRELFDLVRLDHFRAFADYWEVPAHEQTARHGQWKRGPGEDFFRSIEEQLGELPFVAEDLGEINDDVFHLRDAFRLPGMKVLQFAFDENISKNDYIPHNYTRNFIAYTGTHDNNTTRGWYRQDIGEVQRRNINRYVGREVREDEVHLVLGRLAYASVADIAILPVQDLLGLDESARMNTPASGDNNWRWRLLPGQLNTQAEHVLQEWTWLYNRQ